MTQNMNGNQKDFEKKADQTSWTAFGDPLKNNASHTTNDEYTDGSSPMIEKAHEDGNIVKRD